MEENKKKTYYKESQKTYNDKCVKFAIKYTLNEINEGLEVQKAIEQSGMSANSWIKKAIAEKIERDNM